MKYETKEMVRVVREMSITMAGYSKELEKIAKHMEKTDDLTYAGEAMNCVTNCILNCRLDLIVTKPIKLLQDKYNGERNPHIKPEHLRSK